MAVIRYWARSNPAEEWLEITKAVAKGLPHAIMTSGDDPLCSTCKHPLSEHRGAKKICPVGLEGAVDYFRPPGVKGTWN